MKKRIYVILIFVIVFIMTFSGKSYGKEIKFNLSGDLLNQWFGNWLKVYTELIEHNEGKIETEDIKKELKDFYGYDKEYTKPIRISTTVTITKVNSYLWGSIRSYRVKLGERELLAGYIKGGPNLSEKALREILGYEDSFGKLQEGTSWRVVIDAVMPDSVEESPVNSNVGGDNDIFYQYDITAESLYSGNDIGNKWDSYPESYKVLETDYQGTINKVVETIDTAAQAIDFLSHAKESAATGFFNFIISLGDGMQQLANFAQTWTLGRMEVMCTPEDIMSEANEEKQESQENEENVEEENIVTTEKVKTEAVNTPKQEYENPFDDPLRVNSYVNFSETPENITQNTENTRFIKLMSDEGDDTQEKSNYGFNKQTQIPLITSDVYTITAGKVDSIQTNFFERNSGEEQRLFDKILDFVATLIHMAIYLVAGCLIVAIMWHAVGLSKTTISGDVNERNKHQQALKKLIIAIILLATTLLIEALCMYLSKGILSTDRGEITGNKYEGPIRVTVEDTYSFSTTPTGYVRYMAGLTNIYLYGEKGAYAWTYFLLALGNMILSGVMFLRSFVLMIASVYGFWIILIFIFKAQDASTRPYMTWLKAYFVISAIEIVISVIAKIELISIL